MQGALASRVDVTAVTTVASAIVLIFLVSIGVTFLVSGRTFLTTLKESAEYTSRATVSRAKTKVLLFDFENFFFDF